MAITIGSNVVVDDAGDVTAGSGLKLELFNAYVAAEVAPALANPYAPGSQAHEDFAGMVASGPRFCAKLANATAGAIGAHLVANAKVSVSAGGLQTSTASGSPTGPPAVAVLLAVE